VCVNASVLCVCVHVQAHACAHERVCVHVCDQTEPHGILWITENARPIYCLQQASLTVESVGSALQGGMQYTYLYTQTRAHAHTQLNVWGQLG